MRSAAHLELVRESITTSANLAHERTLPVVKALSAVVPSGRMQRGSTLAVHGVGSTSFGLALVGEAVRDGSFLAVVAPESFGLAACLDFDIPLRRVVQFVLPSDPSRWAQSVASIVEGFDVVVLADRHRVSSSQARQLTARNRERGSVLVRIAGPAWPDAADIRFDVSAPIWSGLGQGHGYLRSRQVSVQVAGRRFHGKGQAHQILLPAAGGGVQETAASITELTPAQSPASDAAPNEKAAAELIPTEPVPIQVVGPVKAQSVPTFVAPADLVETVSASDSHAVSVTGRSADSAGVSDSPGRFAGADIDAFLDAIEQKKRRANGTDDSSGNASDSADAGLDATA